MTIGKRYRDILKKALAASPFRRRPKYYRLGKYYVDYSELSQEQLDSIPDCEELFRNSVPVNRRNVT